MYLLTSNNTSVTIIITKDSFYQNFRRPKIDTNRVIQDRKQMSTINMAEVLISNFLLIFAVAFQATII